MRRATVALAAMLGLPANAEINVLNDDNAATYWARSDRFDTAIDLTVGRRKELLLHLERLEREFEDLVAQSIND